MKEYRARKKEQLGAQAWLKRERDRVKGCYTPTELLTEVQKSKRREKNRKNAKRFYIKQKQSHDLIDEPASENQACCGDDNGVSSTTRGGDLMTVKMPFAAYEPKLNRSKGPKKRQSRALKRSYKRIETLEDHNETLKRKLKSAQKRIQRYELTKEKEASTPKSKTDALLKRAGMRPNDVPEVRKQLLYAECIHENIKQTMSQKSPNMVSLQMVSGKVIKKYRLRSYLEKKTMIERRKVVKSITERKKVVRKMAVKIKADVKNFLNRDDNSRIMPGKGDYVKVDSRSRITRNQRLTSVDLGQKNLH